MTLKKFKHLNKDYPEDLWFLEKIIEVITIIIIDIDNFPNIWKHEIGLFEHYVTGPNLG